jgi:anti-anti-sigma factor
VTTSAPRAAVARTVPDPGSGATSFRCDVTYFDDWARVTAKGCVDVSTVPVMRRTVLAAAVLPISGVTLDLVGVTSLDRHAIDTLVALGRQVRDQGSAFALASISEPVRRALDVAGVGELFDQESVWSGYPSPDPQA